MAAALVILKLLLQSGPLQSWGGYGSRGQHRLGWYAKEALAATADVAEEKIENGAGYVDVASKHDWGKLVLIPWCRLPIVA